MSIFGSGASFKFDPNRQLANGSFNKYSSTGQWQGTSKMDDLSKALIASGRVSPLYAGGQNANVLRQYRNTPNSLSAYQPNAPNLAGALYPQQPMNMANEYEMLQQAQTEEGQRKRRSKSYSQQ